MNVSSKNILRRDQPPERQHKTLAPKQNARKISGVAFGCAGARESSHAICWGCLALHACLYAHFEILHNSQSHHLSADKPLKVLG